MALFVKKTLVFLAVFPSSGKTSRKVSVILVDLQPTSWTDGMSLDGSWEFSVGKRLRSLAKKQGLLDESLKSVNQSVCSYDDHWLTAEKEVWGVPGQPFSHSALTLRSLTRCSSFIQSLPTSNGRSSVKKTHPQSIGLLLQVDRTHSSANMWTNTYSDTRPRNGSPSRLPPQRIPLKIVLGASKQETNGFQPRLNADKALPTSTSYL
ncbi:hypothetical protein BDP67DRAFT_569412 [Colletotrichum lupini]|nr:hypothetical protein BDP67DRAFT_569412 [Colletotrichum lupini]